MKVSLCIDMMFSTAEFYDKFGLVKGCGYDTVEFWKWTNKDVDRVESILKSEDMKLSIFNIDSTDEQLSYDLSRGILNDGRCEDFIAALKESIPVYKRLGASAMIVLIGENAPYNKDKVKACLTAALPLLAEHDVNLVVEPLNDKDRIGYSMPWATPVFELLDEINSPHVKMLYDIYHQNMMGDFDLKQVLNNIHLIGHFHVADCPGRHQPGTGEVDYVSIIKAINETDYKGHIGLEYRATLPDSETLGFLKEIENA